MDRLHKTVNEEDFDKGCAHISNKQMEDFREAYRLMGATEEQIPSDNQVRAKIMFLIACNPLCAFCHKKDEITLAKIELCSQCKTEWYCSNECEEKHKPIHSKYCQDLEGDWPVNSPFRIAIGRIVSKDTK